MAEIKVLDNSTINKIAAGEVIERPSSVVKELIENSIDAGATSITIEIKDGGMSLIKVSDNGCGIKKEQVKTAFIRHATNKISDINDLINIMSLGFRGEALSSIASVSQLEMTTRNISEEIGTKIEMFAGNIIEFSDTAVVLGTTFCVKNLFYNVPVRKKFLKRPATESSYVSDMVHKLALGHSEISFRYINNSSLSLHTSGNNDLKTTVFYVYGKEIAEKMIDINFNGDDLKFNGLLGKPEICRSNRTYGNLYINGRFVKNELVQKAIEEGFKTRLPIGKFPVYVLNLEIPPASIDVNVHPTKLEVRFENENKIYQLIFEAITKALKDENLIPKVMWDSNNGTSNKLNIDLEDFVMAEENPNTYPITFDENTQKTQHNSDLSYSNESDTIEKLPTYIDDNIKNEKAHTIFKNDEIITAKIDDNIKNENNIFDKYKIIGQLFNTYWIIEQSNKMYIIDQHAAHERILYEQVLNELKIGNVLSQKLIEPIIVPLTPLEKDTILKNEKLLLNFGFEFEIFGNDSLAVNAVAVMFKNPMAISDFLDIIDLLSGEFVNDLYEIKINAVATIACKAAVKANDILTVSEAVSLIENLLKIENPFSCPHGRPTIIEMSKYELEKKFKRVQ